MARRRPRIEIERDLDQLAADLEHLRGQTTIRTFIEARVQRALSDLTAEAEDCDEGFRLMKAMCGNDRDCIVTRLRSTLLHI